MLFYLEWSYFLAGLVGHVVEVHVVDAHVGEAAVLVEHAVEVLVHVMLNRQ